MFNHGTLHPISECSAFGTGLSQRIRELTRLSLGFSLGFALGFSLGFPLFPIALLQNRSLLGKPPGCDGGTLEELGLLPHTSPRGSGAGAQPGLSQLTFPVCPGCMARGGSCSLSLCHTELSERAAAPQDPPLAASSDGKALSNYTPDNSRLQIPSKTPPKTHSSHQNRLPAHG